MEVLNSPSSQLRCDLRKKYEESLAKTEHELEESENSAQKPQEPPRQLIQYLVRMGSFTSVPALHEDSQDMDFVVPSHSTRQSLIERCLSNIPLSAKPFSRTFVTINTQKEEQSSELSPLRNVSLFTNNDNDESLERSDGNSGKIRILTWNVLAQALAEGHDNFVGVPEGTLDWNLRRLHILHEIIAYDPDIICLQEVDHYKFIKSSLKPLGYRGVFCSKPDSPCIYLANNNGPDGCALFFRTQKFDLVSATSRIIEIWKVQSNQVCILANLKLRESGEQLSVVTTHLKAKQGALLSTLRNEQGKDVANFLQSCGVMSKPFVICGDFNAVPTEPVIETIKKRLSLKSAYSNLYDGEEPPFTTWKVRGDGEYCHTIDYIFHNKYCVVESLLNLPTSDQIGPTRLPNPRYPSDHIAIACDFSIIKSD